MSRPRSGSWRRVAVVLGTVLLLYYAVPVVVLVVGRAPANLPARLAAPAVASAATNSLLAAAISTAVGAAFGIPLAYWLARTERRGTDLVTAVVVLPLVLPPVVSGMVLVAAFGPDAIGGLVAPLGIRTTRSLLGIVLAQTFVASPFVVVTARAAFEGVDGRLEDASRSLGRGEWATFRHVTLPLARPGIVAGLTLAFARAMGEFGATLVMAYYPRTMPVQIWVAFVSKGLDAAVPVALALLGVAVGALLVVTAVGATPWR